MTSEEERRHLTDQLSEYAEGVLAEWMSIIELEDVAGIQFQARLRWQDDGTALMGESQYSEEYGRFRFTVHVEDLGAERDLIWVLRTWADVRQGDTVRMPGSDVTAVVATRYWPATDDARGRGSWHVVEGEKHWDDHVVQEGECVIRFATDPEKHARFMNPDAPVEIQMERDVAEAVALMGWEHRVQ